MNLIPFTVSSQYNNLQLDTGKQIGDLEKLINQMVVDKVKNIVAEKNVKIFADIQKQNKKIQELERKFDR